MNYMRAHQSTSTIASNKESSANANNTNSNGNCNGSNGVSSLAESLSQFGNVKNEFIVSGRIAAKNLIQERRFEEAVRVCEMVLAVDSGDIETVDLKERAIVYINNPDQFDLHQMQKAGNDGIAGAQRLLRSASERRVRKSDGGAIIGSVTGLSSGNANGKSSSTSSNQPSTSGGNHVNGNGNPPNSQPVKLRRTRSELHRPASSGSSVLEKIKEFERQSKTPANGTSTTTAQITRIPDPVSTTSINVQPASPLSPANAASFSYIKIKTEPLTPVAENSVSRQKQPLARREQPQQSGRREQPSARQEESVPVRDNNGRSIMKWTDLAKTIDPTLKSQLETNLFASPLVKKACILTTKAEVWASCGWTYVRKAEFEVLLAGMSEQSYLTGSKLRLDGTEFSCLSGTATVVRARVQKLGVNCTKLNNILVIAVYEHPVLPKEIAMLVRRIGEILAKNEERMILV